MIRQLSKQIDQEIKKLIGCGYLVSEAPKVPLETQAEYVRAGRAGGLPWDVQTSDVVMGCLPLNKVCYGQCFAANLANKQGINFAKRVERIFDEDILNSDYKKMPKTQKWVRNGWNSDPCWNWDNAIRLGIITKNNGRHVVYNTKFHVHPTKQQLEQLLELNAEIRLSISAMDDQRILERRLGMLQMYRKMGGVGAATVITSRYKYQELNDRQDDIIKYLQKEDIPSGEMPFRASMKYGTVLLLDDGAFVVPGGEAVWFGRLYPEELNLPVLASTAAHYTGLNSNRASELSKDYIDSFSENMIPTYRELLKGKTVLPDKVGKAPEYKKG